MSSNRANRSFQNKVFLQLTRLNRYRQLFQISYLFDRRWVVLQLGVFKYKIIRFFRLNDTKRQVKLQTLCFDFNFKNLFRFFVQCAAIIHIYKVYCATHWYIQIYTVLVDPAHILFGGKTITLEKCKKGKHKIWLGEFGWRFVLLLFSPCFIWKKIKSFGKQKWFCLYLRVRYYRVLCD